MFVTRILGLGTVVAAAMPVAAQSGGSASTPPQIVVSAVAEVRVAPDRAVISFSVETRGQTAAAAASDNSRRQKAVVDAIRAKMGGQDQLSTSGYMVTADERFDAGQRKVVGYIARNSVVLETRLIDRAGVFIDAALAVGSNLISGLRFFSSTADEARRSALAAAVKKARADAEAMASAAGGALGGLIELSTSYPTGPIVSDVSMATVRSASPETPITAGEQMISAFVSARWLFVGTSAR